MDIVCDRHGLSRAVGPYIEFRDEQLQFVANNIVDSDGDGSTDDPSYQVIDPWGNPYVYRENESDSSYSLSMNAKTFVIYSLGPDGLQADELIKLPASTNEDVDNITNWRRPTE